MPATWVPWPLSSCAAPRQRAGSPPVPMQLDAAPRTLAGQVLVVEVDARVDDRDGDARAGGARPTRPARRSCTRPHWSPCAGRRWSSRACGSAPVSRQRRCRGDDEQRGRTPRQVTPPPPSHDRHSAGGRAGGAGRYRRRRTVTTLPKTVTSSAANSIGERRALAGRARSCAALARCRSSPWPRRRGCRPRRCRRSRRWSGRGTRRSRRRGWPASIIESPRTRSMNRSPSPVKSAGRGSVSSMFSWASTSVPAATSPTRGTWRTGRRSTGAPEVASKRTSMARGLVGSRRRKPSFCRVARWAWTVDGRREAHRLADLAHRRRVAPVALVLLDDLEDLPLAGGERDVGHGGPPWTYRCSEDRTAGRTVAPGWQTPVRRTAVRSGP